MLNADLVVRPRGTDSRRAPRSVHRRLIALGLACAGVLSGTRAALAQQPSPPGGSSGPPQAATTAVVPVPEFFASERALRELVLRAVDANPGLKEAEARHRAALQKIPQATALPDPAITVTQMVRSVETRVGPQLNSLMVSQALPWFGKRDLRGRMADAESTAAFEAWQAARRDVIAQVKAAFYNLGYVDTAISITEQEQSILAHYEQLAQDRYASGAGLLQAVIKVQAELTRVLNRLYSLRQQREVLAARLNTLMNRQPEAPIDAVVLSDPPLAVVATLDLEALFTTGEATRHEVQAVEAQISRSTQSVALAAKNSWPDFMVGAGLINVGGSRATGMSAPPDSGKNALTLSLGLSVPLWREKLRAAVRQADQELAVQQQARARIVNDLQFDVRDQVTRLRTLADQIRLFQSVLIPQANEAQRSTETAYQTGEVGVIDLLDSERVLLDVQLANQRQRVDFLLALAALERAIGARFPR